MRTWRLLFCLLAWASTSVRANLIKNGGFESGLNGWRPFWSRQQGAGRVILDEHDVHSGARAARIEHEGEGDWSFEPEGRVAVQAGQIFQLEVWAKVQGSGSFTLCVSTWDGQGKNISWVEGERSLSHVDQWTRMASRFIVADGVTQIQPRLIGYGPATAWVDDFSLVKLTIPEETNRGRLPPQLALTNTALIVTVKTSDATVDVLDRRTGRVWRQNPARSSIIVTDAHVNHSQIELKLWHAPSGLELESTLLLDTALPEFTLTVDGDGELPSALRYPCPFASAPKDRLIVPMNEGISYPVEDPSIETFRLIAYGGHGICMSFWGMTDDRQGYGAIIETPDDAAIQLQRLDGLLAIGPEWDGQKGLFGYPRKLRYTFYDHGVVNDNYSSLVTTIKIPHLWGWC